MQITKKTMLIAGTTLLGIGAVVSIAAQSFAQTTPPASTTVPAPSTVVAQPAAAQDQDQGQGHAESATEAKDISGADKEVTEDSATAVSGSKIDKGDGDGEQADDATGAATVTK